jgi:transcriptional regulator with XRE-family HTH domain
MIMGLPVIDATTGEKIRFYRKQAGLTQKELAELCELSESAIRNYELGNRIPDFYTLHTIAEKLRVNYYAIADAKISELGGAVQALYDMETCYGLYPTVVDGKIHFVFRDGVSVETSPDQVDLGNSGAGTLLQLMLRGYLRACALHREGNLTDEEYALWKSKSPAYLEDCREIFPETVPVPEGKTQEPAHKRKRKINNGH